MFTTRKSTHHHSLTIILTYTHRQFQLAPKFLEVQHYFLCNWQKFFYLPRQSADYTITFNFNSPFYFPIKHNCASGIVTLYWKNRAHSFSVHHQDTIQRFSSILLPQPPPTSQRECLLHHSSLYF